MLTLRILIKKYYFYIFSHTSYFPITNVFNRIYINNHYWRLNIETTDIFLRSFPHPISLVEKNDASSGTAYTSNGRRRTNCATFLKLRGGGGETKTKEQNERITNDGQGGWTQTIEGSVKKIFRDEETRDAIFCSKQLIRPRWFFPYYFLPRAIRDFILVLFATVQWEFYT